MPFRADTKVLPLDARGVCALINKRPYLQHWKWRIFSRQPYQMGCSRRQPLRLPHGCQHPWCSITQPKAPASLGASFQGLLLLTASHFRQSSHEKLSCSGAVIAETVSWRFFSSVLLLDLCTCVYIHFRFKGLPCAGVHPGSQARSH